MLERFAAACRDDYRIVAGFLYGSHAAGTADAHSDVDLVAVAADGQRDAVWHDREILIRRLGDPLQVETFDGDDTVFFILAGGADGELTVTDARGLPQSSRGPHRAIHDPDGILAGVTFTGSQPDEDDQVEQLRRQVQWFWHDMAHFTAALGRAQLWWAGGQLDELRRYCVNLARLRADFSGHLDGFDKLDTRGSRSRARPRWPPPTSRSTAVGCWSPHEPWPTTTGRWSPTSRPRTASRIRPSWRP